MPDVHDEDEAVGVGVLPHLMFKGVVEDEDFTFLPLPGLGGAADPAALLGDDEAQVHPESAVGGSGVGPHVGPRVHDRELNLSPLAARCLRVSLQQ